MRTAAPLYRLIARPPTFFYAMGLGRLLGRRVLLLSTTGRRTGLSRTTPLQYEWIDGAIWVGSVRGESADWYRNLEADPRATVRIGAITHQVLAETTEDVATVVHLLQVRLERHPWMVGTLLRLAGVGAHPDRAALQAYARRLAVAVLRPQPAPPTTD